MFELISRTFSTIFDRFKGKTAIEQSDLQQLVEQMREALIQADVPYEVTQQFLKTIQVDLLNKQIPKALRPDEYCMKLVHDRIVQFLGGSEKEHKLPEKGIIVVMGLQGSGKTTTLAKLAQFISTKNPRTRLLLASVDFQRPAAIDQLEILATRVGSSFYRAAEVKCVTGCARNYATF